MNNQLIELLHTDNLFPCIYHRGFGCSPYTQ